MSQPTVHVVDGDATAREAVSLLVRSLKLPVEKHASAEECRDSLDRDHPTCLVLEHELPGRSGLAFHDEIRSWRTPWIRVIVVSRSIDVPVAVRFMQNGAVGVLEKPFAAYDLSQLLTRSAREAVEIHVESQRWREVDRRLEHLGDAERSVLDDLVDGRPLREIAERIGVSERTVERRRSRILETLGVATPLALTRLMTERENWHARW